MKGLTEKKLRVTLQHNYFGELFYFSVKIKKAIFNPVKKFLKNGVKVLRSVLLKLLIFIVPALFILSRTVFALAPIMPLGQVKSGMSGTGYTVIDNRGVIEPFDVEIVGVTNGTKGAASMIMARASGDLIERTGGVLQGMSGSPVYIDGKLIGALAIGLKEMSPYTFFITPIENMVKIWELPDRHALDKPAIFQLKPKKNDETKSDDEKILNEEKNSADETVTENETSTEEVDDLDNLGEEKTAIFFSGFDKNGLEFLKKELTPLGFKDFYAAPAASNSQLLINHSATLVPGEPFGVAVVCGDFTVGATGTVTAVDNDKIVGFGHSFAHAGNVNYFMTDANVLGPISGTTGGGMRIASTGNIIGRINQDRDAGIAGILGKFPNVVPISVRVKNSSLDTDETYRASIAYNESLLPKMGASIAYTALSKSLDSLEEATVAVDFKIQTNVTEDGFISRKNMFYNDTDVGQVAIVELLQALNLICSNVTAESDVFNIEVNMDVANERKSASLVSAVPDKTDVKPGQTVKFTVTLQPYRKPAETIVLPYTIPLAMKEGTLTLDVHGGALVPVVQNAPTGAVITPSTEPPDKEYEKRIKNFLNAGKTNQIVIEPTAMPPTPKTEKELKREIERAKKAQERVLKSGKTKSAPQVQKFDADYIIDNVIQVSLNVGKL